MAAASPTPMPNYTHSAGLRIARHYSGTRTFVRRDSPPSTANAALHGNTDAPGPSATSDDDDDDLQPPPQLSDLGRSVLEQHDDGIAVAASSSTSPRGSVNPSTATAQQHQPQPQHRATRSRAAPPPPTSQQHSAVSSSSSTSPASKTPARSTTTPAAPSQRVKRVGLQGAPVRRMRRTPQSEDENNPAMPAVAATNTADDGGVDADEHHAFEADGGYEMVDAAAADAAQGQENVPVRDEGLVSFKGKADPYHYSSAAKPTHGVARHAPAERPAPLAPVSANTPRRPAPPPPPKMSVLEAATKAVGPSATRKKSRRANVVLNGKSYTQMGRCGKGGSAEVFRVQAENGEVYALKKVRLAGADPAAIAGYKGEIDLLRKLQDTPRVIRLLDYMVDEEKLCLYVLMDLGEGDLGKVLSNKLGRSATDASSSSSPKLDFAFIRYWWKEMLECVGAVHDMDVVHTDLKPANFLVVKGSLKLIDFGIAGAIDVDNTVNMHRDSHVGTVNYMSPESLQDSSMTASQHPPGGAIGVGKLMKLGKPSDVWSLGCILYQMVYGAQPFGHIATAMSKVLAIINPSVQIAFPSTGMGGSRVPPELRRTLKLCLQRDPSKRPTVRDMLSETDAWVHPEGAADLRISQSLLDQMIRRVADRFKDKSRPPPTEEEIAQYAGSFYAKIRDWAEEG